MAPDRHPIPRATYRLQLNSNFTFADAGALAPYLAQLGVSHVYASPFLKARPGSTHGYDIVDHGSLNPDLGSSQDFEHMSAAFQAHDLGLILDFVPNHMGVGGADNPFWLDMLEWGASSDYAGWFDIDWHSESAHLDGKVLVPILGAQYGTVLMQGGLELRFDAEQGEFAVWAYDTHKLPIFPGHYGRILGNSNGRLEELGDAFAHMEAYRPHEQRRAGELKALLAKLVAEEEQTARAVSDALQRFRGAADDIASWNRLDHLIRDQHWRVAFFRVAADDINYRRFFNVNELAGLRIEHQELFDHAHRLVFELIDRGRLDGLRIDHIDGLLDPKAYCLRLREKAPRPIYLVVEKILAENETLRSEWKVDGTTGYEFANLLTGLLVDPSGETRLTELYREFTGEQVRFAAITRECKLAIMQDEMASELDVLARDLARVARSNPLTADFTRNVLHRALTEVVASFRVYRTYIDFEGPTAEDLRELDYAVTRARRLARGIDRSVFDFLADILSCRAIAEPGSGFSKQDVMRVAMKFQQYTGPVMAKSVEDTAFYRFNRFVAVNEVGGRPDRLGTTVEAFHLANSERHAGAMLGTSTHDTKRGEDVRARLAALSEIAEDFSAAVRRWHELLHPAGRVSGAVLDANAEFLLYQLMIGAWPCGLAASDKAGREDFHLRVQAAMLKSVREAKQHTNWSAPDESYETVLQVFIASAFENDDFLDDFVVFQEKVAALGASNTLVQTVLKFTVPGVPDIYQGAEHWELSLVDPDNRRPVDWSVREKLLRDSTSALTPAAMANGSGKLAATAKLLGLRREQPELFRLGDYRPIEVDDGRVLAFSRNEGTAQLVVIARRFPASGRISGKLTGFPAEAMYRELLSSRDIKAADGKIDLADLLADLPAAVLVRIAEPS